MERDIKDDVTKEKERKLVCMCEIGIGIEIETEMDWGGEKIEGEN